MFDKNNFLEVLKKQCQDFHLECRGAWCLSPNVFAAQIKEKGDKQWVFVFYYDDTQTRIRDLRQIHRTLQLLMEGFEAGSLSKNNKDPITIFHLAGGISSECPVGNIQNALNYATQLFLQIDDAEIPWLNNPEPLEFSV